MGSNFQNERASNTPPPFPMSFFLNDTATTEIYTLSLHDALPICSCSLRRTSTLVGGRHGHFTNIRCRTRSEEHTSELQPHSDLVCRLLLEKKKNKKYKIHTQKKKKKKKKKTKKKKKNKK